MIGRQDRWQEDLFVAGPLSSLIPEEHILKQVDKVLDLSWLRSEVKDLYCCDNGRPGIDPEASVRLMLAGFFQGIVHDRKLMREAQVNFAIRWFAGYRLDEKLPDHSSLTKIRQRWGDERFKKIKTLTADCGYAHGKNFELLEDKDIDAIIPPQRQNSKPRHIPLQRFKYDARNKIVKCPGGKVLTRRTQNEKGWVYRARAKDCRNCQLRKYCISEASASRTVLISNGYEAHLRARRRHRRPDDKFIETYKRHRWRAEGMHGEAKTQHGLRRAVRRGLSNVAIQAYLTAAVINLKRLVAFLGLFFAQYCFNLRDLWRQRRYDVSTSEVCANFGRNFHWRRTG